MKQKNRNIGIAFTVASLFIISLIFAFLFRVDTCKAEGMNSIPGCNCANQANNSTNMTMPREVVIYNKTFVPDMLRVNNGETVFWINIDDQAHTVTSDSGFELNSGPIEPGKMYNHTFNRTGTFNYHCTPHPEMRGRVVVE